MGIWIHKCKREDKVFGGRFSVATGHQQLLLTSYLSLDVDAS
jgi:hypothetical protein